MRPALLLPALLVPYLIALPAAAADAALPPLTPATCSVPSLVEQARAGLRTGSPAYRRLLRHLFKEAAIALPVRDLTDALVRERDPEVLELLGGALATRASRDESPALLQPLLARAAQDPSPAARAAAVRGLRGSPSVESMAKNGDVVTYAQLVRDPAPEVRAAVAENLLAEDAEVYAGHDRGVSEAAVATAAAAEDPGVAARLLEGVSMEQAGPDAVATLARQLASPHAELRAAAARALGGVGPAHAAGARATLLAHLRAEPVLPVRRAALEGLVRLGPAAARALLPSLRAADPALAPEVDAWLAALRLELQEWHLLLREKQRRARGA